MSFYVKEWPVYDTSPKFIEVDESPLLIKILSIEDLIGIYIRIYQWLIDNECVHHFMWTYEEKSKNGMSGACMLAVRGYRIESKEEFDIRTEWLARNRENFDFNERARIAGHVRDRFSAIDCLSVDEYRDKYREFMSDTWDARMYELNIELFESVMRAAMSLQPPLTLEEAVAMREEATEEE